MVGPAKPILLGDKGPPLDLGLTRERIEARRKIENDRVESISPLHDNLQLTCWRCPVSGLYLLISDHLNNRRCQGYSNYHWSNIDVQAIKRASPLLASYWGIKVGDLYFKFEQGLLVGFKGDDSPMTRWPKECQSITICLLFAFLWKNGRLAHSKYSSIMTLCSGLGCHSHIVRERILWQLQQLSNCKQLSVWCTKYSCWALIQIDFAFCSDWPFESAIGGLLGHGSKCLLHGITHWNNGKPCSIHFTDEVATNMLLYDMPVQNYDVNFEQWHTQQKSGYTLTNNSTFQYMHDNIFEPAFRNMRQEAACKNKLHLWTHKYDSKKRASIANKLGIYVNNLKLYDWLYRFKTEWFHAFDNYMNHLVCSLLYDSHCLYKWNNADSRNMISQMSLVLSETPNFCVNHLFCCLRHKFLC